MALFHTFVFLYSPCAYRRSCRCRSACLNFCRHTPCKEYPGDDLLQTHRQKYRVNDATKGGIEKCYKLRINLPISNDWLIALIGLIAWLTASKWHMTGSARLAERCIASRLLFVRCLFWVCACSSAIWTYIFMVLSRQLRQIPAFDYFQVSLHGTFPLIFWVAGGGWT